MSRNSLSAILLFVCWTLSPSEGIGQDARPVQVIPKTTIYTAVKIKKETKLPNGKYKLDYEGDKVTTIGVEEVGEEKPQKIEINLGGFLRANGTVHMTKVDFRFENGFKTYQTYFYSFYDEKVSGKAYVIAISFDLSENRRPIEILVLEGVKTSYTLTGFD